MFGGVEETGYEYEELAGELGLKLTSDRSESRGQYREATSRSTGHRGHDSCAGFGNSARPITPWVGNRSES